MSSHAESPLEDFELRDIQIEAQTAGSVANTKNWSFRDVKVKTADGSDITGSTMMAADERGSTPIGN